MKKISNHILILLSFFISISAFSQEKIKGNKYVTFVDRNISNFEKIEIIDDLNVHLTFGESQSVAVETDSNLQEIVTTEVKNGILTIKTDNKIGRKKELIVHIKLNTNFKEISAYNNVNVTSKSLLVIDTLTINAFDNADFDLNLSAKEVQLNCKKTSNLKMEILCNEINITSEESSNLKGAIQTNYLTIRLLDKSNINITGSAKDIETESLGNSTFKGSDFKANNAIVKATNNSKIHINALQNIDVYTRNSSEVYIYSNPKIQLIEFFDRATLYKRDADKKLF
jgi:hypothetical protein